MKFTKSNVFNQAPLFGFGEFPYHAQVIPAEVDHIDFTWRASPHTAVPYKMTFIHTPGPAMDPPTLNVSMAGLVPTYPDKFRLNFPCTGKVNAEVDTLLQVG